MIERVGFIGLGRMGTAMATNLSRAGFPLTVHNRSPAPMAAFAAEHGTATASDPTALAEASDVVITMLAVDEALRDVMSGPRGVIAGLRPGSLVIDMGTVGRQVILDLAGPVADRGAELIDAPVSGVPKVAAEGRLVIMVGADEAPLERARPVLEAMSERIIHVGPRGAGAAMKVAINAAIHGLNQAVSEALVLAERAGIAREAAYDVLAGGAVAAPYVLYKRDAFLQPDETPVAFTVELMRKDLRLVLDLADRLEIDLTAVRAAGEQLERASALGLGGRDFASVAEAIRDRAGARGRS
jgi:3-hydroxyisobutyrate dehydrogenase/2-hydroxy-3-oxopropionate reductase